MILRNSIILAALHAFVTTCALLIADLDTGDLIAMNIVSFTMTISAYALGLRLGFGLSR